MKNNQRRDQNRLRTLWITRLHSENSQNFLRIHQANAIVLQIKRQKQRRGKITCWKSSGRKTCSGTLNGNYRTCSALPKTSYGLFIRWTLKISPGYSESAKHSPRTFQMSNSQLLSRRLSNGLFVRWTLKANPDLEANCNNPHCVELSCLFKLRPPLTKVHSSCGAKGKKKKVFCRVREVDVLLILAAPKLPNRGFSDRLQ